MEVFCGKILLYQMKVDFYLSLYSKFFLIIGLFSTGSDSLGWVSSLFLLDIDGSDL